MDSYDNLPDKNITLQGEMSKIFLEFGIKSFKEACMYVHEQPYGYNSDYDNHFIFFKEGKGTCTSKHAVIAALAAELGIPLYNHVAVYKFTEEICTGAEHIIKKYNIPYVPMQHCFLNYGEHYFDLTEGNNNGKNTSIELDVMIHHERVDPFISKNGEYFIVKKVLKEKILPTKEMEGISEKTLLKARSEGITLLHEKVAYLN